MSMPWFRLYHEFATDPKVQMLSEKDQRRYIMLLCLRCCNGDVTLQNEEVSFQLRISIDEWEETKAVLMEKNLIDEDAKPTAWDKRQYKSDSSADRVARHRAKKAIQKQSCNVTETKCNAVDTETETETDTETETETEELPIGNLSAEESANSKTPPCPHKKIIFLYNKTLGQVLPQCKSTNKTVEGNLRARWREDKTRQDLGWWNDFFNVVSESDFLMGRVMDWTADFTWLVKPTNMSKVINGNYKNKKGQNNGRNYTGEDTREPVIQNNFPEWGD